MAGQGMKVFMDLKIFQAFFLFLLTRHLDLILIGYAKRYK